MDRDRRRRQVAVVVALLVIASLAAVRSAGRDRGVSDQQDSDGVASARPRFEFMEAVTAPLPPGARGSDFDAALVTLPIVNHGGKVTVTALKPIGEPGLAIEYLGHANCRFGCPGGMRNVPREVADLQRAIVGRLPFALESDEPRPLVFALRVTPEGLTTFAQRCMSFRRVEITLDNGKRHVVRFGEDGTLGGVRMTPRDPSYREDCPEK